MVPKKAAALYAIFVGVMMIGMWIVFFVSGNVPELETKPVELSMHLLAEFGTAVLLITGGVGLLSNRDWGFSIHLISVGMLLYTLIMSPGYFLQQGEWSLGIMFAVLTIVLVYLTVRLISLTRHSS